MTDEPVKSTRSAKEEDEMMARSRMSFGDHLEELRSRLIKSLLGLGIAMVLCLFFGDQIIAFLTKPLIMALKTSGLPPKLYVRTLPEYFVTYCKVCLYAGVFLASPWIFHQLWAFIAAGLYKHERRYVQMFVPFSAILFILGGLFFIQIVAPLSCTYFIRFGMNVAPPKIEDGFIVQTLQKHNKETPPADQPPPQPEPQKQLSAPETAPAPTAESPKPSESSEPSEPFVEQVITLQDYISLITILSLAFCLAFQVPLIVFLLGRLNIVPIKTFKSIRKFIVLAMLVISAVLTPPDVISQIALALPMYVLYEIGILMLMLWPKRK